MTTTAATFELAEITLPDIPVPSDLPVVPAATYRARYEALLEAIDAEGLDALVVYGDREHFANLAYLTGFDPRYEEAIMIVVPGRAPVLVVGNENVAYAAITPYEVEIVRLSKFSLVGQPDPGDVSFRSVLKATGLADAAVSRVGISGWKFWRGAETSNWIDAPHFIVEAVSEFASSVENATHLFVEPGRGLRLSNDVDQIAYFEFAASHGSQAMRRLLAGVRPGMTELEASSLMNPILLPFNYHPTMLGGVERTGYGVASPGGRRLEIGDPVCAGIGYWGSNTARAGFLVDSAAQLPAAAADYVDRLVLPYYETAAAWYESIRIGMTAGELYEVTNSRLSDPFYGVFLNPGHYIHLDEWPASAVEPGSPVEFRSGDALQLDIIPGTGTAYHTSQIEDGIVLADATLRASIQTSYPGMWERVQARRAMLSDVFGIQLSEEVLPLSNTAGYLPPYWLAPNLAMRRS
jgi:Xaa-Pro aminopeptidase